MDNNHTNPARPASKPSQAALGADRAVQPELFRVVTLEEFDGVVSGGGPDPPG